MMQLDNQLRIRALLSLGVLAALAPSCFAKQWRTITPLETTRSVVLDLLGAPVGEGDRGAEVFDLGSEVVRIRWIRPGCSAPFKTLGPNAPEATDVVYQVSVTPNRPYPLDSLDQPKPKSYADWLCCSLNCSGTPEEPFQWCTEMNPTTGFGFTSGADGVRDLYYFPAKEQLALWNSGLPDAERKDRVRDARKRHN